MSAQRNKLKEVILAEVLPLGQENAITQEQLAQVYGCKPNEIKARVKYERTQNHAVICSCNQGYYLPESQEELDSYLRMMEGQADERMRTIKPFKDANIGGDPDHGA